MNTDPRNHDIAWVISELCYYLGLVFAVLFMPALTFILWMMSLVDKADPNYWYLMIVWVVSVLMFVVGVGLKNWIHARIKS